MARIKGPPGGPEELEITLRRSARAKRISLRVSALDGQVTLTLPPRVPPAEGLAFARERAGWIAGALSRMPQMARVAEGALIPVQGQALRLVTGGARGAVRVEEGCLIVPGSSPGVRVAAYLKQLARHRLIAASDHYSALLGRSYSGITLRDTRSRWGSCTAAGALNYSWRLAMAPPAVLDYVAAHEVAHLAEMNHSDLFWAVVDRLCPGWQAQRTWLKTHGTALHAWRFED